MGTTGVKLPFGGRASSNPTQVRTVSLPRLLLVFVIVELALLIFLL